MAYLFGSYECKADAKGRFMLPAALKKQLEPVVEQGFVLKKSVYHQCLELFPMEEWNTVMKDVGKLNLFVKETNDFIRKFTAGYKFIELDNTGRIQIPRDLMNFSGIKKEVVVTASVSRVEIWDKERYDAVVEDDSVDFATLAAKVIGDKNEVPES